MSIIQGGRWWLGIVVGVVGLVMVHGAIQFGRKLLDHRRALKAYRSALAEFEDRVTYVRSLPGHDQLPDRRQHAASEPRATADAAYGAHRATGRSPAVPVVAGDHPLDRPIHGWWWVLAWFMFLLIFLFGAVVLLAAAVAAVAGERMLPLMFSILGIVCVAYSVSYARQLLGHRTAVAEHQAARAALDAATRDG